jgi:hypothetical protein
VGRAALCRVWCALLFLAWTAEIPGDPIPYEGRWNSFFVWVSGPLFLPLPGIRLSAWQSLVLLLTPVSLAWPGSSRNRARTIALAIFASLASITITAVWGLARNGSAYQAYYQLWRFLAALAVAAALLSVIRTARCLRMLGSVVLAAALVRGSLAIYHYVAHVRGRPPGPAPAYMTTHDDSLLFVAGVVVAVSWALARNKWTTWSGTGIVSALLCIAMIVNLRRLAWIELALALLLVWYFLPAGRLRRRAAQFLVVAAPVLVLYVVVGRGREEAIFEPVRALYTSGSYQDVSSLARLEEIKNLLYTMSEVGNPLLGTGWGHRYFKATDIYATTVERRWPQYVYQPHNSLLGLAVFGGLVGLFGIWLVVPVTALVGTRGHRRSTRAVDRAASMAAVCILPAYGAHCYGDLGLQSLTCGLLLSVAMATAGKVPVGPEASKGGVGRRGRSSAREAAKVETPGP